MRLRAPILTSFFFMALFLIPALGNCQSYQVLQPCYVDVAGWQKGELQGMMMTMGATKMLTGTVNYSGGDKEIDVVFNKGMTVAPAVAEATSQGMTLETNEVSMKMTTMRGFTVQMVDRKGTEKGSHLMVILEKPAQDNPGSILIFDSESVQLKELLPFAKRFDWACFVKKAATVW